MEEGVNMKAAVITDKEGIELDVINSSMEEDDMAEYTLSLVKQITTHRGNLLKKTQEVGHVTFNLGIEQKLDDLAKHTLSMASQARARTSSRCRSDLARSVSRGS